MSRRNVFQTLLRLGENSAGLFGFGTGQYLEFSALHRRQFESLAAITKSYRSVLRGIKSTESPCGGAGCNEAVRFAYEYRIGSGKMVNDGERAGRCAHPLFADSATNSSGFVN